MWHTFCVNSYKYVNVVGYGTPEDEVVLEIGLKDEVRNWLSEHASDYCIRYIHHGLFGKYQCFIDFKNPAEAAFCALVWSE